MLQNNNGLFRGSTYKVLELVFGRPNYTFHLRKLAKETGLSTTAVAKNIKELEKNEVIDVENTELTKNIKANTSSEEYRSLKRVFNLYQLEYHGLVKLLRKTFNPKVIVLFGSFSKGEDIEESDIDLLILTNQKKKSVNLGKYEKSRIFEF